MALPQAAQKQMPVRRVGPLLVLGRMGGSVTRTLVFGRSEETVLWFAQPGA